MGIVGSMASLNELHRKGGDARFAGSTRIFNRRRGSGGGNAEEPPIPPRRDQLTRIGRRRTRKAGSGMRSTEQVPPSPRLMEGTHTLKSLNSGFFSRSLR